MGTIRDFNYKSSTQNTLSKTRKSEKTIWRSVVNLACIEIASLDTLFLIITAINFISFEIIYLIPLFFILNNLIYLIFSHFIFKPIGYRKIKLFTIIGLSTLLISCIFLTFPSNTSLFSMTLIIIIFLMYGFSKSMIIPVSKKYISDLITENSRIKSLSAIFLFIGLLALLKSVIIGFLYYIFSFTIAFTFIIILVITAIGITVK